MSINEIPVRVAGAGTQPPEEDGQTLSYIDMPGDMWTYTPPCMPEPEAVEDLTAARESMRWLQSALDNHRAATEPQLANLSALDDDNRELVNQILGEGEVSISFDGSFRARTQEAVLAGVWRTLYLGDGDVVVADVLEVGDAPHTVRLRDRHDRPVDTRADDVPEGVVNALPLLVELEGHCRDFAGDGRPREINLTLLPLTDADVEFLDDRLGRGPVDTLSRAYGKCQVTSTMVPNVWWVRYYNSMGTLILNTLQVAEVPAVLCAAEEDLDDSAERLGGILAPYWPDAE